MRFFGNYSETIVTTDNLERAFLIQHENFYDDQYIEVVPVIVKDPSYEELPQSLCQDLTIPEDVLAIVGYN